MGSSMRSFLVGYPAADEVRFAAVDRLDDGLLIARTYLVFLMPRLRDRQLAEGHPVDRVALLTWWSSVHPPVRLPVEPLLVQLLDEELASGWAPELSGVSGIDDDPIAPYREVVAALRELVAGALARGVELECEMT